MYAENQVILDCEGKDRHFLMEESNDTYPSNSTSGLHGRTVFSGIIFRNGATKANGGSIYIAEVKKSISLFCCSLIFSDILHISFKNCSFEGNRASNGGAVYPEPSIPKTVITFEYCHFFNNSAENRGKFRGQFNFPGGAVVAMSDNVILSSTFLQNSATKGGAAWIEGGSVENTTFSNNSAKYGGAVYHRGLQTAAKNLGKYQRNI